MPSGLKLSLGSLQSILKYAMSDDEYLFRCNKALKQNGFDISTGGLVKYNIEPTPTKPKNKPKKSNTKYIAIGVIAIVAIIAIIFASSSLTTNSSNSDLALKITHAYISHTGYSNITGEFNHVPDNMEGLSVKVEYFNSSGGLVETTMSDGVKPTDKSNEYTICEEKANNNTIDKIKVYILDNKGDTICYDEYKLDFNNLPLTS